MSQPPVQARPAENKMGYMPVNKLLITMGLPMMVSMMVMALYNVVDSIFVARLSEDALTAVSLAFPVQNFMIAVGVGTGVGVNAFLSKSLGEKNFERANQAANNGFFLSLCSTVFFVLFGLTCIPLFFSTQTDDPVIAGYGTDYLWICSVFCLGMFVQSMGEKILVATGRTLLSMAAQLLGAVTNIVLDPILIFGLLGAPALGVKGAAIATVLGQFAGGTLVLVLNIRHNPEIELRLKGFRPNAAIIGRIYSVGVPSIVMASVGSVMTFLLNRILMGFTSTAVAVFGVYFKLQSFVFMPIFGLNNGMVPIIGYNYGARKPERMVQALKWSIVYATCIMLVGLALFNGAPQVLLGMFDASENMLAIGVPALRTISLTFLFAGFSVISSSSFQALGRGVWSMTISLVRQLCVLIPAAYLLSLSGKLSMVWLAFPIAEIASVLLCLNFLRIVFRDIIGPMRAQKATDTLPE